MRHVLLESFVWEEANRVPFLIREFSYDRDLSVGERRGLGHENTKCIPRTSHQLQPQASSQTHAFRLNLWPPLALLKELAVSGEREKVRQTDASGNTNKRMAV